MLSLYSQNAADPYGYYLTKDMDGRTIVAVSGIVPLPEPIAAPTNRRITPPGSKPPRHANPKTNELYKTELCKNHEETGTCKYGRACQFAHGRDELRPILRHEHWRSKTCLAWLHGGCSYGSRCCYARRFLFMLQ